MHILAPSDKRLPMHVLCDKECSDNNFIALCINIRSIVNHKNFAKLEGLLSSLSVKPSIIAVTETWLKPAQTGFHINLPGYTFLSNPRIYHRRGGVAFYIRNNLTYTHRMDVNVMNEKIIGALYIDIKLKEKTIT